MSLTAHSEPLASIVEEVRDTGARLPRTKPKPAGDAGGHILELLGISKSFLTTRALKRVDLQVLAGEVHVICGENGAGKSTLMNILNGIHRPDEGEILIKGQRVEVGSPLVASRHGIGMVHQHFTLVPSMSVAENLFLGRNPTRYGLFSDRDAMRRRSRQLIERYNFELDPDTPVNRLSVGQKQRVEILKALAFDAEILILDEPTAVLTPPEVDELLGVIDILRKRGRTIIFITHKLREVKAIADRVTIFRHGESVSTYRITEVSEADIAHDMVGRQVFLVGRQDDPESPRQFGEDLLRISGVTVTNSAGRRLLDQVSFNVRSGEVFGMAGVDGNGQTQLAEVVAGLMPVQAGRIHFMDSDVTAAPISERMKLGLGFIPEDRLDRGLSATMSIEENVAATNYVAAGMLKSGFIDVGVRNAFASDRIKEFDVRGATLGQPVGWLSGGNMQKIVIARELARKPRILVVSQPTRGLDIGAAEFIQEQILEAADNGAAVLLISSELTEVLSLADRIGVMYNGRLPQVLRRDEADEKTVGFLMNGGDASTP